MPDESIFSTVNFNTETLSERLREAAFLLRGVAITLKDERPGKEMEELFQFETGLEAFVDYLNEGKEPLHPVVSFSGQANEIEMDFSFQFHDAYTENVLSFVNNVRTRDGGTHELGAKTAVTRMMNEHAKKSRLVERKRQKA